MKRPPPLRTKSAGKLEGIFATAPPWSLSALSYSDAASCNRANALRLTNRMRGRLSFNARLLNAVTEDVSTQPRRIAAVKMLPRNDRSRRIVASVTPVRFLVATNSPSALRSTSLR